MARMPRIPDLLTTANLCCGLGSILLASQGQLTLACWLVFAGAMFDVLDGLAARALGGGSELGKQLDSLADMVTFGVAPAFLVFWASGTMIELDLPGPLGLSYTTEDITTKAAALVLVVASCWRLAKFNLDTRQTSGFLGLPTPANGLFLVSVVLGSTGVAVHPGPGNDLLVDATRVLLGNPYVLLSISLALAALMLSELPLPSLKFKHFRWQGNQVIYLLAGIGLMLVALYGILGVPLMILLYILSPIWGRLFGKGG
jgi:CDP-diacylglycerol---serine O-phosphatidyltransferase